MSIRPLSYHRHPICPRCKYDLYGTLHADGTTCPECGYEFDPSALPRQPRKGDWQPRDAIVRVLVMCLVRGLLLLPFWVGAILSGVWMQQYLHGWMRGLGFIAVLIMGSITHTIIGRKVSDAAGAVSSIFAIEAAVILTIIVWSATLIAGLIMPLSSYDISMALIIGAGAVIAGLVSRLFLDE